MSDRSGSRGDPVECSFDRARLDLDAIHRFLSNAAYWSIGVPPTATRAPA